MRRIVAYVPDETYDRLVLVRDMERRSLSQVAAAILEAAVSDVNGEHLKSAPGADWGTETPDAEDGAGDVDGAVTQIASPPPRRPGPVSRALERRERP